MSGFRQSVARGMTLVREALRSPNFATGVTGWNLDRDGNAEFNDVSIRGSLTAGATPDRIDVGVFQVNEFGAAAAVGQPLAGGRRAVTFDQGQANRGYIAPRPGRVSIAPPDSGFSRPELALIAGGDAAAKSTIQLSADVVRRPGSGTFPIVSSLGGVDLFTTTPVIKAGTSVIDKTPGDPDPTILFPGAFPGGLASIVISLGDSTGATSAVAFARALTGFQVRLFNGAVAAANGLYRVEWIAVGW